MPVPERIAWAVETLRVAPGDRLLEIGCGAALAAAGFAVSVVDGTPGGESSLVCIVGRIA